MNATKLVRELLIVVLAGALGNVPASFGAEPAPPPPPGAPPAAAPAKRQLTIEEAVRRALETNERMGQSRASLDRSQAAVGEAFSAGLPALSANSGVTRTKTEPTAAAALLGPTSDYSTRYTAAVQASQALFQGGQVWNSVAAARARRDASQADLRTFRTLTIYTAAHLYYDASLAREVHGVRLTTYKLAEKHYHEVQAREKAGTASRFDVLRAKVAMQNTESDVITAENSARLTQVQLMREIGLPQDAEVELVTGFSKLDGKPVEGGLVKQAFQDRPELASAELGVKAQNSQTRAAYAGYLPKVSATASWGGSSSEDPFQDDHFTESGSVGLAATWTFFDGLLTRARVAESKADLARLQWARDGLRRDVELEVRQSLLNLASARRNIESQGANVEEATEAMRLAEARQNAGTATELDVEDARNALEQAKLNQAQAYYQYSLARLDLDKATGGMEPAWSKKP